MILRTFNGRRFARAKTLINLLKTILDILCGILVECVKETLILAEKLDDLGICAYAERSYKCA